MPVLTRFKVFLVSSFPRSVHKICGQDWWAGGLIVILFTICNKLPLVHLRYDGHDIFGV